MFSFARGVNSRAELETLTPGLRPERRFAGSGIMILKYPDDDCILVETLILNHNENILYSIILYEMSTSNRYFNFALSVF